MSSTISAQTKEQMEDAFEKARRSGLMYLLYSDDTPGSIIQNTAAETSLKTFALPANNYSYILIEAEIKMTNNVRDSNVYTHSFTFKMDTTVLRTFNVDTEEATIRELYIPFKYKIAGGSSGTIGLFGQVDTADTGLSFQALSLRVYGIN